MQATQGQILGQPLTFKAAWITGSIHNFLNFLSQRGKAQINNSTDIALVPHQVSIYNRNSDGYVHNPNTMQST